MLLVTLTVIALVLACIVWSVVSLFMRRRGGFGWSLMSLLGSLMMLSLIIAYISFVENTGPIAQRPAFLFTSIHGALGLILFVWAEGNKRRARLAPPPGFCSKCGYHLRGLREGVCPECGAGVGGAGGEKSPES